MIAASLLDTDVLSEVLKNRHAAIAANAQVYLRSHAGFAISAMTWFEIVRWLRWKDADSQLTAFEQARHQLTILPVTLEILDRAADLWAMAASRGKPKADADLIIAATALEHGLELVTGNQSHFDWIPLLTLKDWRN